MTGQLCWGCREAGEGGSNCYGEKAVERGGGCFVRVLRGSLSGEYP